MIMFVCMCVLALCGGLSGVVQVNELERLYSTEVSKFNRAVEELQNIQVCCVEGI